MTDVPLTQYASGPEEMGPDMEAWKFMQAIDQMAIQIHNAQTSKGFTEHLQNPLFVPTKLALIITEIAEAIEFDRCGNPPDSHLPQYPGLTIELADAVIRILDLAGALHIPLGPAIIDKLAYNASRPQKHGKLY